MEIEEEKPKCKKCNKSIKKFTTSKDWAARDYHKACYKKLKEEKECLRLFEQLKKELNL